MTQQTDIATDFPALFARIKNDAAGANLPWLDKLRRAGLEVFNEISFPSPKSEDWLHTNVAPIARQRFDLASGTPNVSPTDLAPFSFANQSACELVFVNGQFAASLSKLPALPQQLRVLPLSKAMQTERHLLEAHLGKCIDLLANPFASLNSAFIQEGAFVHVPRGVATEKPIHLLFYSTASANAAFVSHPRILVLVDDTSEASIVETYAGSPDAVYFTNVVSEIVLGHNARVEHCKVQQESLSAFHIATTEVRLGRTAYYLSHNANLGSRLTRNNLNVVLGGSGAEAMLNGTTLITGSQHVDNHTLLDHQEPRCPSHEFYKHVLDQQSTGVFKGKILVRPGAQKTDSKQSSKSLLLNDSAIMHSQPALEIYADDVKCTHGSTTGPVDESQIFYLRSRGVSLEAARHLLTYAFLAEITSRINLRPVRDRIEGIMAARHGLPQDLRIADIG